jgi:hypothetical protein
VLSTSAETEKKNVDSASNGRKEFSQEEARKSEQAHSAEPSKEKEHGAEVGQTCPECKKGVMVKIGGCTQCSKNCGFTGTCDTK